jgi:Na+-transporting methylmalonyl-CoA/oxaloacetate decarboxylase gamma subunit
MTSALILAFVIAVIAAIARRKKPEPVETEKQRRERLGWKVVGAQMAETSRIWRLG